MINTKNREERGRKIFEFFDSSQKETRSGALKKTFLLKDISKDEKNFMVSYFEDLIYYLKLNDDIMENTVQTVKIRFDYIGKCTLPKGIHLRERDTYLATFFINDDKISCKCRTNTFSVSYLNIRYLKSFTYETPISEEAHLKRKLNMIRKACYYDTWSDLNTPDSIKHLQGNNLISIKKKFSANQLYLIKKAFENKENIHIRNDGYSEKSRDYSVETKMCEDGIFRAWYSSEYHGCANGDYYLLLNPTQAIFGETD